MGVLKTAVYTAFLGISIYLTKQYMNGAVCTSTATIPGKIVVITGANTGIGKETAADLAKKGGKVYMACRSIQRCNQAAEDIARTTGVPMDNLICMNLDLGSINSIREFAADFKKREKKIDVLINNAGVMFVPNGSKTEDGFEATFGINHLGHFMLTNLLMNEIITAAPSRIVTVSSLSHKRGSGKVDLEDPMLNKDWSTREAYSQSKLANILFSKELSRKLKGSGVTTYSLHPGIVHSELTRYIPYLRHPVGDKIYKFFTWPFMKDAWHGAQTQICCAVDEKLAQETGKYYADCVEEIPQVPAADDNELAKNLWYLSIRLLNMSEEDFHPKIR